MFIGSGTAINVGAIFAGALIGTGAAHKLSVNIRGAITDIMALIVGLVAALNVSVVTKPDVTLHLKNGSAILIIMASLIIGTGLGTWLAIEQRIETLGDRLTRRMSTRGDKKGAEGFLTATLVFCIGPMAILGSLTDGLGQGNETLVVKSALDFFTSIALAATFGLSVGLSAITVGLYQGIMTGCGYALGAVMTEVQIYILTATGGLILIALAMRLLDIKKFAIGNMLPALAIAPLVTWMVS